MKMFSKLFVLSIFLWFQFTAGICDSKSGNKIARIGDILHITADVVEMDLTDKFAIWEFSLNGLVENIEEKEFISPTELKVRLKKDGNWHINIVIKNAEKKMVFESEDWVKIVRREDFVSLDHIDNMWTNRHDFEQGKNIATADEYKTEIAKTQPQKPRASNGRKKKTQQRTKSKSRGKSRGNNTVHQVEKLPVVLEKESYTGFTIQVAAVESAEMADSISGILSDFGIDVYTQPIVKTKTQERLYRVRVGHFAERESALSLSEEIQKIVGNPVWITKSRQDF